LLKEMAGLSMIPESGNRFSDHAQAKIYGAGSAQFIMLADEFYHV